MARLEFLIGPALQSHSYTNGPAFPLVRAPLSMPAAGRTGDWFVTTRFTSGVVLALLGYGLIVQVDTSAQPSEALVIRAKRIYTVTKGVIENGDILVVGGKIQAVGRVNEVPPNARRYSAEVVIPGMIDAHSHMALDRMASG